MSAFCAARMLSKFMRVFRAQLPEEIENRKQEKRARIYLARPAPVYFACMIDRKRLFCFTSHPSFTLTFCP